MYKRMFVVLVGFSLLAGCGGGGGSTTGGVAYTGVTTQATVTTANAKALSIDALTGSQLSSSAGGAAKETTGNGSQSALLQETAEILKQSVTTIVTQPASSAKSVAITAQNTINGFSGSYTYSVSYDPTSGACSGTMTYIQYKATSTSTAMSGTITYTGTFNQASGAFPLLNMTMSNLTVTSGGISYSLTGNESFSTSGATETETMSLTVTNNASGRTFWERDYTLIFTGSSLTLTGTYYDPIHGYVVISTLTPMAVSSIDATPTAGQLLFTGSNGTKARLTFTGSGYTVEADTAGNGTYVVVP